MNYICRNENCSECGKKYTFTRISYKYINGKLMSDHALCPKCGEEREEINPNACPLSEKNIQLLMFDMASPEKQREMLKKRSHEHFKEKIEPYKKEKLNEAVTNFKEASRK